MPLMPLLVVIQWCIDLLLRPLIANYSSLQSYNGYQLGFHFHKQQTHEWCWKRIYFFTLRKKILVAWSLCIIKIFRKLKLSSLINSKCPRGLFLESNSGINKFNLNISFTIHCRYSRLEDHMNLGHVFQSSTRSLIAHSFIIVDLSTSPMFPYPN